MTEDMRDFERAICLSLNVMCWRHGWPSMRDANPFPRFRLFRWLP